MATAAVKNQAETRWFTFAPVVVAAVRQTIRFAKIAWGGMSHWTR